MSDQKTKAKAAALRANLRKRKTQLRSLASGTNASMKQAANPTEADQGASSAKPGETPLARNRKIERHS